jgi:hypothetical protein
MNEQDTKMVVDYFRNKAAELEMQNIELQLQVMKLAQEVADLKGTDESAGDSADVEG